MKNDSEITRKELLEDLDRSIEKALDAKLTDITGALLRLKASTVGWCDQPNCGKCPLAPLQCTSGLEAKVQELINEHHALKQDISKVGKQVSQKLASANPPKKLSKFNLKKATTGSTQQETITEVEMFTE
ncbi:hypothetical protein [Kordiimonas laminariae]|uniref:hypothetical protein n=1 Tax=Kordiimonas laminariae TaxID=2917717 RepID=UPI001FF5F01D|nr:hypothetical protein [Kordiimonas laminariae]MCK0069182.1 hypothetical protein [Kordiimonas laminariae]